MTVKAYQQSLKEANLLPKFNVQYKHQCIVGSAPCKAKGIRIPDSEKFSFGMRNPGKFCLWNPEPCALESGIQLKESLISLKIGIRNPSSTNKRMELQAWNPESMA